MLATLVECRESSLKYCWIELWRISKQTNNETETVKL